MNDYESIDIDRHEEEVTTLKEESNNNIKTYLCLQDIKKRLDHLEKGFNELLNYNQELKEIIEKCFLTNQVTKEHIEDLEKKVMYKYHVWQKMKENEN